MERQQVVQLLVQIMQLLLKGDYVEVERLTNGRRYPATELKRAIESHYEKLSMPPDEEIAEIAILAIHPTMQDTEACAVTADFWVQGNGRSDLSLECTFHQALGQPLLAQIDNLHVM